MSDLLEFYKYRAISKNLIASIVDPHWYFSKPDSLNDPFDCRVKLKGWAKMAALSAFGKQKRFLEKLSSDEFNEMREKIDAMFKACGVFCAATDEANSLMWSHYADSHRGCCIKYQFEKSFIKEGKFGLDRCTTVNYGPDVLMDLLCHRKWEDLIFGDDDKIYYQMIVSACPFSKGKAWEYENEVRCVRDKSGVVEIPPEFIKGIYFGMQSEHSEIDLIRKLASNHCGCSNYYGMEPVDGSFEIVSREIT